MESIRAVIISGGLGSRMGKIGKAKPKSLLPIANKPLLWYQLKLLQKFELRRITICAGYHSELVSSYIACLLDKNDSNIKVEVVVDPWPAGSGGCLQFIRNAEEDLLILFGDIAISMDLERFIQFHITKSGIASIVLQSNDHLEESDLVKLDRSSRCVGIYCKPHYKDLPITDLYMVAGLFLLKSKLISIISENRPYDLVKDILATAIYSKEPVYGYYTDEYLDDIGTPERYKRINLEWIEKSQETYQCY